MNRCVRVFTGIGVLVALGLSNVIGCSESKGDPQEQPASTGKLRLGLVARAQSGNVYRLRDAFFDVVNARTGEFEVGLFSEDFEDTDEITTILDRGSHFVTLNPGWFLELVSGSGNSNTGGASSTGGIPGKSGSGGFIGKGAGGSPSFPTEGGFAGEEDDDDNSGFGGDLGFGGDPGPSGGFGGDPFPPPPGGFGGDPFPPQGGFSGIPNGPGQRVDAFLTSDAVQGFFLNGGDDAFVTYTFQVGGDQVDFNRGRLHIGIAVDEVEPPCVVPEGVINPRRALFENSVSALSTVVLSEVFDAIAQNEGHGTDSELLYQEIFDSYASTDNARLADAVHCGDETTEGFPALNGYPLDCDRAEHAQIDNFFQWFATGFVNRMDLAPQNGAHCGQQRMIFSNSNSNGFGDRVFMIIEAQIPNPAPELGIQGCAPLAQFWLDQNSIDDPLVRGERLREAFLFGQSELLAAGFGPFMTPTNLTVGSGQIRTNNFNQFPWTLREFKLALDGDELKVLPFPTAEAPHGNLFNEFVPLPAGEACRDNFLDAMEGLLTNDPAEMSFVVNQECKDSESRNDFSQDYGSNMSDGFVDRVNERFAGTGLDAFDLANRAWFAGSCIGCHNEATGLFLGNGVTAPFSHDFVHSADFTTDCGGEECFPASDGMTRVFLPQRLRVMGNLLGIDIPANPCDENGGGGFGGAGGFDGGASGSAGGAGEEEPAPVQPAPEIEITLPEASTPVEELDAQDSEIREEYGELTIGNRSAQVTH